MQKLSYIILLSMMAAALNAQSFQFLTGATATSANGLLQAYNISNATIKALVYTNVTYQGNAYLIGYNNSNPSFLINTTGGTYSFVLNSTAIATIIGSTIVQQSVNQINRTYLTKAMKKYNSSSSGPLSSCLVETGLASGTCTNANFCASCSAVPVCRKVISATGGIYGGFAQGIIQFSSEYKSLESNFSNYFSYVNSLNSSNAQSDLGKITAAFDNVSSITNFIYQNAIFPPPQTADFSQCNGYGATTSNVTSQGGPWYCSSIGFCEFLTYNYSLLGNLQDYINNINSLPVSSQQINQIAASINTNENIAVAPLITKQKLAIVKNIVNTTLAGYSTITSQSTVLLTHLSNKTLQNDLARMQANYTLLTTDYVSQNITKLNKILSLQYSTLKTDYAGLNATYSTSLNLASNNTVKLVELQLGNRNPSTLVTALSFQQAKLNSQIGGSISNPSVLAMQMQSISQQSKSLSNNPSFWQSASRAIDAPVVEPILASLATPYSSAVQLAPILSIIPALIVGIIALLGIFFFQGHLIKHNRLAVNSRTRKNWHNLFIAVVIAVVILMIGSFVFAYDASLGAPISAFVSAVHGSKSIVIALNGTNNTAMMSCASKVKTSLTSEGKTVQTITIKGIACNNGMPLETADKCMAYYAAHNMPVVMFTNSSADTITAYSYYGSVLNVNGDVPFMNTCLVSTIVR